MAYDFEEQRRKGKFYEKHFFDYLEAKNLYPSCNNPLGNNEDFDISANGRKYEVKSDFYPNKRFPIELAHLKISGEVSQGWAYVTQSDFIVFYKEKLGLRYYLKSEQLKNFLHENLINLKTIYCTRNKKMLTWNAYLTEKELDSAGIIKLIEEF